MHYTTANKVWDKLQEIHEENLKEYCSSRKLPSNHIPKNVSKNEHDDKTTCMMSHGVIDSEDDRLEENYDLKIKIDLALKNIVNLKDKLQEYDNKDNIKSVNVVVEYKKYCEGIPVETVSLKEDLEK